jgi:hypothetical protein
MTNIIPAFIRKGTLMEFIWDEYFLTAHVSNLIEEKDGTVKGQLKWTTSNPNYEHPHLLHQSFNFSSPRTRTTLKTEMTKKYRVKVDWDTVLEQLSELVIEKRHEGSPFEELWTDDKITPPEYKLYPILPEGEPTILFADGGSGKSYVSQFLAICVILPWIDNPLKFKTKEKSSKVLILDYEDGGNTARYRLARIKKGHNLPEFSINHRRCEIPLCKEIDKILSVINDQGINTVIIDSAFGACDGDLNENATAKAFFQAVRAIPATTLILHHVAKNSKGNDRTAYGSAFFRNAVRSSWELVSDNEQGSSQLRLGLFNRKANNSMLHKPIGIQLNFIDPDGPVVFSRYDIDNSPEFEDRLSLSQRIHNELRNGALGIKDIVDHVGKDYQQVANALNKLKSKGDAVHLPDGRWGLVHDPDKLPF